MQLCYYHVFYLVAKPAYHMCKNDVDWAPSINLSYNKLGPERSESVQEWDQRAENRKRRREEVEQDRQDDAIAEEIAAVIDNQEWDDGLWDKETQTKHTGNLVVDFFGEDDFTSDDEKVKYYTGLPNGELLREVFKLVVPFPGTKREYYWKSFIAVMMKLRLNLGLQDMAYRLQVPLSTMTRRYHEMLQMLYIRLKFLIMWPECDNLRKTMPLCFRAVYGVKVVDI